jgi:hypothetical protein
MDFAKDCQAKNLTKQQSRDIMKKMNNQTVEAEITVIMLLQRARVAESRAENKSSNGPLRVQSKARAEYSATCWHTSVAGDMLVSR